MSGCEASSPRRRISSRTGRGAMCVHARRAAMRTKPSGVLRNERSLGMRSAFRLPMLAGYRRQENGARTGGHWNGPDAIEVAEN